MCQRAPEQPETACFLPVLYQAVGELPELSARKSFVPDHRVDVSNCQAESEGGAGGQQELPESHGLPLTERSGQPPAF